MVSMLSNIQVEELQGFRLTTKKTASPLSVQIDELLDEHFLRDYLLQLGQLMETANDKVTASIFIKNYVFLPAIYLYAMTAQNRKLDISFENLSIEIDDQADIWLPRFYLNDLHAETAGDDRKEWREKCVKSLFNDHLFPLIDRLSRVTKISKLILWENIAVYIIWLYENVLEKSESEEVALRAKEDFQYIFFQAPGSIFGGYNDNPLKRYFNEPIYVEETKQEVRPRNTCCFNYLTKSKIRCASCPQVCAACPLVSEVHRREEEAVE